MNRSNLGKSLNITRDQINRGLLLIGSGQVARMALGLVSSVLIARALGSSDYGFFGVAAATTGIVGVLTDMGLSTAIAQQAGSVWNRDAQAAQQRARVYFWTRVAWGGLIVGAGWLLAKPLASLLLDSATEKGVGVIRLAFLGVGAMVLSGSSTAMLRTARQFKGINVVVLVNAGMTTLLALFLFWRGELTIFTALVVLGVGTSLLSFLTGWYLLPSPLTLRVPTREMWKAEQGRMLRFSRWVALSNLLAMLTSQLDVIMVNRWFEASTAGIYFLALNLATKLELVNHSQHMVLVPVASTLKRGGEMGSYAKRSLKRNGIMVLVLLPAALAAGPLIPYFYGQEFAGAIPLFRIMVMVVLLDVFTLPIRLLFYPLNRPELLAIADGVQAGIFILGTLWLAPILGPAGAIWAKGAGKLLSFVVVGVTLFRIRSRP